MSKSVAQNDLENDDKNDDYIGPHQRMADAQDDVINDVTKSIWGFLGFFVHNYRPWQLSRFKGSISSNWEGNFECDGEYQIPVTLCPNIVLTVFGFTRSIIFIASMRVWVWAENHIRAKSCTWRGTPGDRPRRS